MAAASVVTFGVVHDVDVLGVGVGVGEGGAQESAEGPVTPHQLQVGPALRHPPFPHQHYLVRQGEPVHRVRHQHSRLHVKPGDRQTGLIDFYYPVNHDGIIRAKES